MSTASVTQTGGAATVAVTVSRGLQGVQGIQGEVGPAGPTDYTLLTNVPATFAPSAHTHPVSDIVSIASERLLGRHAGGSGAGQEVTVGNGLEFQGSGIRRSALTGDVTASAGSNATTIANDAVSNAKLANVATATIKGRITAGTGDPEDLTPAQALEVIGAATPASVEAQILVETNARIAADALKADLGTNTSFSRGVIYPIDFSARRQQRGTILADSGNAVREISAVWFNGAYRVIGDLILSTDAGFPDSFESEIYMWTTTEHPSYWKSSSFTKVGVVIAKGGSAHKLFGTATPSAAVINGKLYVVYSGRGAAAGSGPRYNCLASSTDGITYTDHGPITVTGGQTINDDMEIVHNPFTGRTFIYGTQFDAATRIPRGIYTDDIDLANATWTSVGVVTSDVTTVLPYSAWIDPATRIYWMVASFPGSDGKIYTSVDGETFVDTGHTLSIETHSFRVIDKWNEFQGWGTNGGNAVNFSRRAIPADWSRNYYPLKQTTISATEQMLAIPANGQIRKIRNIKFIMATTVAASGTNYWEFEIRSRSPGGGTASPTNVKTDTKLGVTSYIPIPIDGSFTISATSSLQIFATKVGSPVNLVGLSLQFEEEPVE
jgi:hypothetical protein